MSKKRAKQRQALQGKKGQQHKKPGLVKVTHPGGRVETHPDDGRSYPDGTMLQWNDRWTVVGCGWPFDD